MKPNSNNTKIFVAMSGGVDSSVAALLLKQQGFDVTGVFMKCFNVDGCAARDAEDARRVADYLDIPFYTFDFEQEYKDDVVSYMVEGYKKGITPNPDVMCNAKVKFGLFLDKSKALGADYIATGHYARVENDDGVYKLYEGVDQNKDQSYFLWKVTQDQLQHCRFPVGKYTKPEIRELAENAGLPTADKKDSQGICFLGEVSLSEFLSDYITQEKGDIVTLEGEKIGEHDGVYFYTIGQRHGLHLDAKNENLGIKGEHETKPHYVAKKNVETNTIVVAEGSDNPALFRESVRMDTIHKIRPFEIDDGMEVKARIRYRQPLESAVLNESDNKTYTLTFDNSQKFVAPGQSAVFYSADGEMLGGGVIVE